MNPRLGRIRVGTLAMVGAALIAGCGTNTSSPQAALHRQFGSKVSRLVRASAHIGNATIRMFRWNGRPTVAALSETRDQWVVATYTSLSPSACAISSWQGILTVPPKESVMVGYTGAGFALSSVHVSLGRHQYAAKIAGQGFWIAPLGNHGANGQLTITLTGQDQSYGCPA
jgi:hypothetical protein